MLLADKLPFESPIQPGEIRPIAGDARLIPPSRINPNVSAAIDEVLVRALQFEARSRYQNAQELLVALDTAETMKPKAVDAKSADFGPSKAALGAHSGGNDEDGRRLVGRALECGRTGRLAEAADVMEEAFNKSPSLRAKYSEAVKLWRRGISM
jgi:serine/threonine-protein kinase